MADKAQGAAPNTTPESPAPRRGPGHRADMRDTVAELAEKAHQISLEAGSTVAAAMKDVISAAAGLTGFAIESARDLTNFMVRRGQMTQAEADKLLRDAEASHAKRPASERSKQTATQIAAEKAALAKAQAARAAELAAAAFAKLHPPRPSKPPSKVFMPKPAPASKPAPAGKKGEKPAPRKAAAPAKKAAKPAKPATKVTKAAKPAAKKVAKPAKKVAPKKKR